MKTIMEHLKLDLLNLVDDLKSIDIYTDEEKETIKTKIFFLSSAITQLEQYKKL
tara:strand:+ start:186 stop:347 length:162 start_codon:yes stop_codon:yes gene_type:complete